MERQMKTGIRPAPAILVYLSVLSCVSPAKAQSENPFIGKWTATWENKDGRSLQANVVITEAGGTWQTLAQRKLDPCLGKEAQLEIKSVSPKEMRFTARHSEALMGCKDTNIKMQMQPDGTVTGSRGQDEMRFTKN